MKPTLLSEQVKKDLHISSSRKDEQIDLAVQTAERLMSIRGVRNIDEADPTTAQCVMLYCRYYFNFQGDAESYYEAFGRMADSMAMAKEYRTAKEGSGV